MAGNDSPASRHYPGKTGFSSSLLPLLLGVGGFFALIAALAVIVIYPLWFLAMQETGIYTVGFFTLIAALAILFFVLRWRRAVRNSRLDEFYLRVMRFTVFCLFLLSQIFLALVNAAFYGYLKGGMPFGIVTVLLHAPGCLAVLVSLALPAAALEHKLFGRAGFIVATVLFSLQTAYWIAAFVLQGAFPYVGLLMLTILGFFFLRKITKIIQEKESPKNETIQP